MPRLLHVTLAAAALGVVAPVTIMLVNHYVDPMWWPQWILLVWPTSFMLIATSAIINAFFFEVAAFSVALNALLYVFIAALLLRLVTGLRSNNRWRVP